MSTALEGLVEEIRQALLQFPVEVDRVAYAEASLSPTLPILSAGRLESRVCFLGRDLGKSEILKQQPLCGPAGALVRRGIYRFLFDRDPLDERDLERAVLERVLLTNIVSFKPAGNRPYPGRVREQLRQFLERLLIDYWQGDQVSRWETRRPDGSSATLLKSRNIFTSPIGTKPVSRSP